MVDRVGLAAGRGERRAGRLEAWRLRGTPYVLFYRVDEAAETVWIVVAWSATRGSGPELP